MSRTPALYVEHEGRKVSLGELARLACVPYRKLWRRYWSGKRGADLVYAGDHHTGPKDK